MRIGFDHQWSVSPEGAQAFIGVRRGCLTDRAAVVLRAFPRPATGDRR